MSSGYTNLPAVGDSHWKRPVALTVSLPLLNNNVGDIRLAEDTNTIYVWGGASWIAVATPGAAIAIDGLLGDVSAAGPGVVSATVNLVGGAAAADIATVTTLVKGTKTANTVLAGPVSGSAAAATFRSLVAADIPNATVITKNASGSIATTDNIVFCDTSGGAITLTLPDPASLSGKLYRLIDSTGSFSTNNLSLAPHGAEKIEGLAATKLLSTAWGGWHITTNGTDWFIF